MADNTQVPAGRTVDKLWLQVQEGLQNYDLNVKRAVPSGRGQYRLEGNTRVHWARVLPHDEAAWRLHVADAAADGGFLRVERAVRDRFAQRVRSLDEAAALTVTHHWDGASLQVTPTDVREAGHSLGQLHEALASRDAGRDHPAPAALKPRYGTWDAALRRAQDTLASELQSASLQGKSDEWQDALKAWVALSELALDRMRAAGYSERADAARDRAALAWNGLRFDRLSRLPSGGVAVMQVQSPVLDDALYDVAGLCREILESGQPEGVADLLSAYAEVRPLHPNEQEMTIAFAAFPHMAVMLVQKARLGRLDDGWQRAARDQIKAANALLR